MRRKALPGEGRRRGATMLPTAENARSEEPSARNREPSVESPVKTNISIAASTRALGRPMLLEQAPKKLIDFFDKSLLQHFDFERFLIVRTESALRRTAAGIGAVLVSEKNLIVRPDFENL